MGASAPGTLLRRTVSTVTVMLAAWAAFVGTISVVMLVAIAHAKPEIPGDSMTETSADQTGAPAAATAAQPFKPARASRTKPPTRI